MSSVNSTKLSLSFAILYICTYTLVATAVRCLLKASSYMDCMHGSTVHAHGHAVRWLSVWTGRYL